MGGERLRIGGGGWRWIGTTAAGLALAGVMRPTFWIVVVAWGLISVIGIVAGPRKLSAISLLVLLSVLALFVMLDPRSHGHNPLGGLPEQQAVNLLTEGPETVRVLGGTEHHPMPTTAVAILWQKLRYILHDQLPTAFFGQRVAPLSIFTSLLLIASSLFLWRQPLWLAIILLTFLVTVLLSAEPRYYIMVLPLLALGWILLMDRVQIWLPNSVGTLLAYGLLLVVVGNNIARAVPIIIEATIERFHRTLSQG